MPWTTHPPSSGRRRGYWLAGVLVLAIGLGGTWLITRRAPQSRPVMVFAAASLRDVMSEVESAFAREDGSTEPVLFNSAGSNVLAQQIIASSQADIFLSANEQWMDYVEKAGRLIPRTRKPLLSNRMVIVAHPSTDWRIEQPADLARIEFEHLSLANPEAVPAGTYAKAFLEKTRYEGGSLWEVLAPKVAPAPDVRAALALVEADPAVVGIVYCTDAAASGRVRILFEIPEDQVPPIRYSAARVYRPDAPATSERFFDFLFSRQAQAIFAKHGFLPVPQTGKSE